jgi:hypothetical protein
VLGHLGTQQLGAVSLASLATSLATYIFSFLVFLTTPRIAAAHAHGDSKTVSRLAAVGLWLAAVTGTAVALGMHAGAGMIVQGEKHMQQSCRRSAVPPAGQCADDKLQQQGAHVHCVRHNQPTITKTPAKLFRFAHVPALQKYHAAHLPGCSECERSALC